MRGGGVLGLSEVGRKERFSEKYLKVYGEDEMPPERVFAFLCAALATFGRHRGLLITYYYHVRLTTHYLLLTTYGSLPTVHYGYTYYRHSGDPAAYSSSSRSRVKFEWIEATLEAQALPQP